MSINFWRSIKLELEHYRRITIEKAKKDKYEMFKQLKDLEGYNPKYLDKINSRKEALINAEELYNNR